MQNYKNMFWDFKDQSKTQLIEDPESQEEVEQESEQEFNCL